MITYFKIIYHSLMGRIVLLDKNPKENKKRRAIIGTRPDDR
tara:strand:- start:1050 stop:1172 length:123 start_codon:yes stop_codon:yes gene_type:complete